MMNEDRRTDQDDEPLFVISIAAKMIGMHAQSLRHYERLGLVRPSRSRGRVRLYSQADIERLRHIQRLVNDLGVNLAGAEVVIRLNERIRRMEEEMERLRAELQSYRDRVLPAVAEGGGTSGSAGGCLPTQDSSRSLS
jgi:MerR family transcriptional regulator/heat shock protein HspR